MATKHAKLSFRYQIDDRIDQRGRVLIGIADGRHGSDQIIIHVIRSDDGWIYRDEF